MKSNDIYRHKYVHVPVLVQFYKKNKHKYHVKTLSCGNLADHYNETHSFLVLCIVSIILIIN